MRPLRILTWHVHGSYLYYLTQSPHTFYLPTKEGWPEGYGGRRGNFAWGDNVIDVPAGDVKNLDFDVLLTQSRRNDEVDQHELLTPTQRRLPRIHLEHDPPREHPVDTHHFVDDPNVLLVHVTAFNALMWDNGRTPTRVIDHGVIVPDGARYTGELPCGIVVVNGLAARGRRAGADVFTRVREEIPLDLAGMQSERLGGLGDVPRDALLRRSGAYRFFFHPIRYTSLGLAVCEAMMMGMPIVGLATTELVTVIENGVSGFIDTNIDHLIACMHDLIADPARARALGAGARRVAEERFSIHRFARDWDETFALVAGAKTPGLLHMGRGI